MIQNWNSEVREEPEDLGTSRPGQEFQERRGQ